MKKEKEKTMSIKKRKEKVDEDEEKMYKILFNYFKYKFVKYIELSGIYNGHDKYGYTNKFRVDGKYNMYISLGTQSPHFTLDIGSVSINDNDEKIISKKQNKDIYEITKNIDLYNQIEYFIDNSETIKHDMGKLYKTLYETNNLTSANTFLLCSRNTFPRDIRNIIFNKILFFFGPRSGQ